MKRRRALSKRIAEIVTLEAANVAGRVPPHDLDAEAAVLSACMLNRDAIDKVADVLKPEHFYSYANRRVYEAILALSAVQTVRFDVDIVSIAGWLRDREILAEVGGVTYLAQLSDATPAVAHVATHAMMVREKWRLRQLIATCQHTAAEGYGDVGVIQEFLDDHERKVFELSATAERTTLVKVNTTLRETFAKISAAAERGERITGLSTGYEKFDAKTAGLHAGDLTIVAGRPGMGKCLSETQRVLLADGSMPTIGEIVRRRKAELLSLGADYKLRAAEASHFIDDGIKPVFRVRTRLGRCVETTLSHPFLTMRGWRPLVHVAIGEHVAVPRKLDIFGNTPLPEHEVKLLAYLIGDGGLTGNTAKFTNKDPRLLAEFTECVRRFGSVSVHTSDDHRRPGVITLAVRGDADFIAAERKLFGNRLRKIMLERDITTPELAKRLGIGTSWIYPWLHGQAVPRRALFDRVCTTLGVGEKDLAPHGRAAIARSARNPMVEWLERLGIFGNKSAEHVIPDPVFTMSRELVALFLNRLFAADGWASEHQGTAQIGYCSISEKLVRQVQHLLCRFGIIAKVREKVTRYNGKRYAAYHVEMTSRPSILTFASEIGIFGKEDRVERISRLVSLKKENPNVDVVPAAIWNRLAKAKRGESWVSLAKRAGLLGVSNIHAGKRGLSRGRLSALAAALGDNSLSDIANSDVYWDEVVAIEPIGKRHVFDLTVPNTHNFVAEDICVHNTSFVMNLAVNVAAPRVEREVATGTEIQFPGDGVAVFSLEMPREQLATRMVCSEGRVDLGRLRQGFLQPDDWKRLTEAASFLSTLPLWIDDTPAITLQDVRAKVRRLQAEYNRPAQANAPEQKVGLVIIDYLQLMKGRDDVNSREQEISEISRGLKQLAKELKVPVIALSQLNRTTETRSTKDKRPQLSDLRECLAGETVVANPRTGELERLDARPAAAAALAADHKVVLAEIADVWPTGVKQVVRVTTASGRQLRCTTNHPLRTIRGWEPVADIQIGTRIAVPRSVPEPTHPTNPFTADELRLLGYLISDGHYGKHRSVGYVKADPALVDDVRKIAKSRFGIDAKDHRCVGKAEQVDLTVPGGGPGGNPLIEWLKRIGIHGEIGPTKTVPRDLWKSDNRHLAIFLGALWAGDGCVMRRKKSGWVVKFTSTSSALLDGVQWALIRLGIVHSRGAPGRNTKSTMDIATIFIEDSDQVIRFSEIVPVPGKKGDRLRLAAAECSELGRNARLDRLPIEITERVHSAKEAMGISWTKLGYRCQGKTMCRDDLKRVSAPLGDDELYRLATSDILWDELVSVMPDGEAMVYDFHVPGPSNIVANGIFAHNSGALEQDADMIVFVYRDEYYNPETTNAKGLAELIIAKQRNGPTGKVMVRFTASCTRFDNLNASDYPMVDDE